MIESPESRTLPARTGKELKLHSVRQPGNGKRKRYKLIKIKKKRYEKYKKITPKAELAQVYPSSC